MEVIYKDDFTAILCGDCKDLKYSKGVDAVVTDPPIWTLIYGKRLGLWCSGS